MPLRIVVAGIVVATSTAFAAPTSPEEPKSTTTAVLLTVAGTALPTAGVVASVIGEDSSSTDFQPLFAAASVGLAVLPAAGHWYTHRIGALGLGIRAVGTTAMIAGFHLLASNEDGGSADQDRNGILLLGGGAATVIGGVVYDLISCRSSVRAWNRRAVQATLIRVPDGYGFGLAGGF